VGQDEVFEAHRVGLPARRHRVAACARPDQQLDPGTVTPGVHHAQPCGVPVGFGGRAGQHAVTGEQVSGLPGYPAMTETTQRISAESLDERLAMTGPRDELSNLAGTINGLLARLEGSFAAQRRFAANAAHELRTPLATIRASLDVAVAKPAPVPVAAVAGRLYEQLDQVERLLDGLLVLARAQHGDLPGTTVLSLDAVVAASLAARADAIAARNLTVSHASDPAGALVAGSAELVRRMVDNVLDNAIIHNDTGGWIEVSAASHEAVTCLIVDNGGGVLDPGLARELAQPFRRLGADRTSSDRGSGLGLSIVTLSRQFFPVVLYWIIADQMASWRQLRCNSAVAPVGASVTTGPAPR
jgi:hypothetical protein